MRALGALALAIGALAAACATSRESRQGELSSHITAAQIAPMRNLNVYEVIKRLRPEYLKMRGPTTVMNPAENEIGVYVDNMLFGGVMDLRNLPAAEVAEIRYLSAANAVTRHGALHPSGVIEITTVH